MCQQRAGLAYGILIVATPLKIEWKQSIEIDFHISNIMET